MTENVQQVTLKKLLISTLINQVVQITNLSVSKQVQASQALKNVVEAIASLKQSEICIINEEEIDELIVKSQLNALLEKIPHD